MRRLALAALLSAVSALTACGNVCQDLGDRLCACAGGGAATTACKTQVQNQIKDVGLSGDTKAYCAAKLDTCKVPSTPPDVQFCEWITTADGKQACGLAFPQPPAAELAPDPP